MTSEIPDSARELIATALPIIQDAELYQVTSAEQYRESAELLKRGKAIRGELYQTMRSLLAPVEETEKRIRDLFTPRIKAWDVAEADIKDRLLQFSALQERKRKAEEERLQAAARAEADRIAKAEAEKARKAREAAQKKADEELNAAERRAQHAADAEEAERIRHDGQRRALEAIDKGDAKAEAALDRADAAASAPLPTVARAEVKVDGISRRKTWKGDEEATRANLLQIVKQAAGGNGVALSLLTLDTKSFQAKAKALGAELPQLVQGVVVREEHGLAAGAAR